MTNEKRERVNLFRDAERDRVKIKVASNNTTTPPLDGLDGFADECRRQIMYACHHRLWWCHRENYRRWNRRINALNLLSLLLVFGGTVAAAAVREVWEMPVTICVAAGVAIKGWMDYKKMYRRLEASAFATTAYSDTLKRHGLFGDVDLKAFWTEMETIKDVVNEFGPALYDSRFLPDKSTPV